MNIIISPAKKMHMDLEAYDCRTPLFLERSGELLAAMRAMSLPELQQLWACNDELAKENYERIKSMDLSRQLTPAALAYVGLQYTHMGPQVLEQQAWEYLCAHLRIISGFYGLLRADDGIVPYRLEMQAKLAVGGYKNLYQYWGRSIYDALVRDDGVILNLASKEYSKVIEKHLTGDVRMVTCIFGCVHGDGYKVKATEAKMARGSMVRWCAEHNARFPEDVKAFDVYGYQYREDLSTDDCYVFLK